MQGEWSLVPWVSHPGRCNFGHMTPFRAKKEKSGAMNASQEKTHPRPRTPVKSGNTSDSDFRDFGAGASLASYKMTGSPGTMWAPLKPSHLPPPQFLQPILQGATGPWGMTPTSELLKDLRRQKNPPFAGDEMEVPKGIAPFPRSPSFYQPSQGQNTGLTTRICSGTS